MSDKKDNALINWDASKAVSNNKIMENVQKYLQNTFGTSLNDVEWQTFLSMMVVTNTNPFLGEIYAVKYGDKAQIFIGRNGYRKIALPNEKYDGHVVGAVYEGDKHYFIPSKSEVVHEPNFKERGRLIGAYFVGWRKGVSRPIYHFVNFEEYYKGQLKDCAKGYGDEKNYKMRKNSKGEWYKTGPTTWDEKPVTMITKVAESQGLRMMLPEMFNGTYDESERWDEEEDKPEVVVMIDKAQIAKIQSAWAEFASMKNWDTEESKMHRSETWQAKFGGKKSTKDLTSDEAEMAYKIINKLLANERSKGEPKITKADIEKKDIDGNNNLEPANIIEGKIDLSSNPPTDEELNMMGALWDNYFEVNKINGAKKHTTQVDFYGKMFKKYSLASLTSNEVNQVIELLDKEIETSETNADDQGPIESVEIEDVPFENI